MNAPSWAAEVAELYSERGLGGRLEPEGRFAVLVVDLVNGFTDPSYPPGSDLSDVVAATKRVLDAARETEALVVFTTIEFAEDQQDSSVWLRKMPALRVLVVGSDLVAVDERLSPRAGETVLAKQAASAFSGTELAEVLRREGVGSVLVCGATTSGCIRATVIDACSLGWPTFVPRQAVGDRAAGPHAANLIDIDAKYADVIDLDQALELLVGGGQ